MPADPGDLREIDRAAAAPFVEYPELPNWYPVAGGAWVTAVIATGYTDLLPSAWVELSAMVALLLVLGAFVGWYSSKRGAVPSLNPMHAPPEIRRAMLWYYAGVAACAVAVIASLVWMPPVVAVAVTFVLSTVGIAFYERAYGRAAEQVRGRLA